MLELERSQWHQMRHKLEQLLALKHASFGRISGETHSERHFATERDSDGKEQVGKQGRRTGLL